MFNEILQTLIDRVPGARGAMFCDDLGETVSAVGASGRRSPGTLDDFDLRVAGAQLSTPLERARRQASDSSGELRELVIRGPGEALLVYLLPRGYFLLLCLEPGALSARGMRHLRVVAQEIEREF